MSEPIKKPNQIPESYTPKKPEIANVMKEATKTSKPETILSFNESKIILNNVLPWNNPWVGCCEFLKCFTSMLLKMEYDYYKNMPSICVVDGDVKLCVNCGKEDHYCRMPDIWQQHRQCIYYSYLPIAGTGLTNAFDPLEVVKDPCLTTYGCINQSYFMTDGYIENSYRYAGYKYKKIENNGGNEIELFNVIIISIENGIPVVCFYNNEWQLITGYDTEKKSLFLCNPNEEGNIENKEWYEKINYILPVAGKSNDKQSIDDILKNTARILGFTEYCGVTAGLAAYDKCVKFLLDDKYFSDLNDDTLEFVYQTIHDYLGYHAETRAFTGQGIKLLAYYENAKNELLDLLNKLAKEASANTENAWKGWNAMRPWPCNPKENAYLLKDRIVRDIIIDSAKEMKKNDENMIVLINEYYKM